MNEARPPRKAPDMTSSECCILGHLFGAKELLAELHAAELTDERFVAVRQHLDSALVALRQWPRRRSE